MHLEFIWWWQNVVFVSAICSRNTTAGSENGFQIAHSLTVLVLHRDAEAMREKQRKAELKKQEEAAAGSKK